MKHSLNIEEIKHLYCDEHHSTLHIAHLYGCSDVTVWRFLKKNGIETKPYEILKHHVRTEEHKRHISESLKGRKIPAEIVEKQRQGMLRAVANGHSGCFPKGHKPNITPERNAKISIARKGVKRPDITGENNPSWRGGISFKYSRYLGNDIWDGIRWRILKRDNHTCQKCGKKSRYLDVHHKIPFAISHNDSDDNLVSLCRSCHTKEEWIANPLYRQRAACSN